MAKLNIFTATRTETDGMETVIFSRFVEDMPKTQETAPVTELAAIIVHESESGTMTIKIRGSAIPAMIGKGQAITFRLEEAP